ncbi:hypothetical protein CIL05_02145 [Virgibacillus profundi]|uniref:Beta-lactamase class A catalytic domain-containing protein n=1 Tax=Virgibacillus profundi TaxID=2024555 RepID=A0A2A2IIL5_9BACI|nr:serine hydrolase [Virgibacillus profundi]PAV31477.1 hypothetical protein CIL05_02145 [Virgibacillus profundi]PXY55663.1 serine hydrolase [Virgibacillus profundi]
MNLIQLENAIRDLIQNNKHNFSISIHTQEGNISINAAKQRKAASLAKISILLEAYRQIENNKLSLETPIYINKSAMVGGSGVLNYLTNSHVHSLQNLLELMIIVSDNTASNLLLEHVGMENINKLTEKTGCKQTIIKRKFMDLQAQMVGFENYTSSQDIATLLKIISKNNVYLSDKSRHQMLEILSNQQFKDKLAAYLTDDDKIEIYHKSGELQGIEHDAAIFKYHENTIEVAVLSEGWINNGEGKKYIAAIGKLLITYLKAGSREGKG